MKRHMLLLCWLLLCVRMAGAGEKTFLWKIEAPAGTLYLLGSIHAAEKSFYPLAEQIEDAFRKSQNLVVEVDITSGEGLDAAISRLQDSAFYSSGDTLQKHISRETFKLVMKEFDMYSFDSIRLQKLRPWALSHLLSGLQMTKSNADSELGIDLYFLKRAPFLKKQILQLESMELQAGLFEGWNDKEQEAYLLYSLKGLHSEAEKMAVLMDIWKSGDVKRLEKFLSDSAYNHPEMPTIRKKILTERNKSMLTKIEHLIQEPGVDFVVVGAAHLIGSDGLVELLSNKGYVLNQL